MEMPKSQLVASARPYSPTAARIATISRHTITPGVSKCRAVSVDRCRRGAVSTSSAVSTRNSAPPKLLDRLSDCVWANRRPHNRD
jgi:hypothetical protein